MLSDQLVTSIAGGGRFSAPLATALAAFQLEKRQAVILSFPVNPALVEDPTAAQLETYFAKNSAVYEAAALRDFSLIWLTAEEIAASISLAEEDVQLAYDTRLDEISTPQTRSVRQMVFDSEEAALAARERLGDPAGFNQLAGELLDWTEDDVRLGTVARSDLDGELAETVFAARQASWLARRRPRLAGIWSLWMRLWQAKPRLWTRCVGKLKKPCAAKRPTVFWLTG